MRRAPVRGYESGTSGSARKPRDSASGACGSWQRQQDADMTDSARSRGCWRRGNERVYPNRSAGCAGAAGRGPFRFNAEICDLLL